MKNWLTRAAKAWGKKPDEPRPSPYELSCDCGNKLKGERTASPQFVICARCHTSVFVLARSPYPFIAVKEPKVKPPPKSSTDFGEKAVSSSSTKIPAVSTPSVNTPKKNTDVEEIQRSLKRWRWKAIFSPFRLLMVMMFAIIGLTGWFLYQRSQYDAAKIIARDLGKEGLEALQRNELAHADRQLGLATKAIQLLKRNDSEAKEIVLRGREAHAANHLWRTPLNDLLTLSEPGNVADRWMIFDVILSVGDGEEGQLRVFSDSVIVFEKTVVELDVDVPLFKRYLKEQEIAGPLRVIFAAELDRFEKSDPNLPGKLRFTENSILLWGNHPLSVTLGFLPMEDENAMKDLLSRQDAFMRKEIP